MNTRLPLRVLQCVLVGLLVCGPLCAATRRPVRASAPVPMVQSCKDTEIGRAHV